ncbi:MAG TPA: pilus assembly PilX N-terminal domain-containing protein [Candidatus Acidoferrales bacterium]|nr:pilus assembly PilX N-terminal domain-containing protein [Candidatus Acidoferrales bacterium]
MKRQERGVALILVMILLFVLSVMAASLLFLSQTETWSSMNYRLMTQSRYGAEAGLEKAVNYLLYTYSPPVTNTSDPASGYDLVNVPATTDPVFTTVTTATNGITSVDNDLVGVVLHGTSTPVVLSSDSNVTSHYPISTVQSGFSSNTSGSLSAGNITVNYVAHAVLLSMTRVTPYGTTASVTAQAWRVTGDATISGATNAKVEVSTIVETQVSPIFSYAAFATSQECGALNFAGGGTTGSYNDKNVTVVSGVPSVTTSNSQGNVGTNGNLTVAGNPTNIYGTLSTPRTGASSSGCTNSSSGVASVGYTGKLTNGSAVQVSSGILQLPQTLSYPTPVIPASGSTTVSLSQSTCPSNSSTWCSTPSGSNPNHDITLLPTCAGAVTSCTTPGTYGDINISGQVTLHLQQGIYNINTLQMQGNNVSLVIDSGPVIINVSGVPNTTNGVTCTQTPNPSTPIIPPPATSFCTGNFVSLSGNSVENAALDPLNFQLRYAGYGNIQLKGGTDASGLLYAPNAFFSFASSNAAWYGAVIGLQLTDTGGSSIYYDTNLKNDGFFVLNPMLSAFTWKKY